MPPHLHPRSRTTSSLFATTVVASFFVVALPHMLPCPAPRVKYADAEVVVAADGSTKRRRRRRPESSAEVKDGVAQFEGNSSGGGEEVASFKRKKAPRECPVPKPPGILGELMGFKKTETPGDDKSREQDGRTNRDGSRPAAPP